MGSGVGNRLGRAARIAIVAGSLLTFAPGSATTAALPMPRTILNQGTRLGAMLPPNAATGAQQNAFVNSVSCPSEGSCSAVGRYQDSSGNQEGLLVTERAGVWAAGVEAVLPANAAMGGKQDVVLSSVSCPSPGTCSAVGTYVDSAGDVWGLLLTEAGGTWSAGVEAALPANAASGGNQGVSLDSVSCPSSGDCGAAGTYLDSAGASLGLLLTETAGAWAAGLEAVLPGNAATGTKQNVSLDAVSCPAPGTCSAVGDYNDSSGNSDGLLLTETAGRWAPGAQATVPANAAPVHQSVSVDAVSCASPRNCSAVGTYLDHSGAGQGLLLSEKAGNWAAGLELALPADAATKFQFALPSAISCPSAGNCSGVGNYYDRSQNIQGLLLTQTAGRWAAAIEADLPQNAATNQQWVLLNSVSCPLAGNCSAVGRYIDRSGNTQGLMLTEAERIWGSGVESAPSLHAYLASVSCSPGQNGNCSAVGSYESNPGSTQGLLIRVTPELTPRPCLVPKLKGKTLAAAERSLNSRNCSLGRIKHATSRTVEMGRVISQQPRPGSRRRHRARVNLVLSSGH